MDSQTENPVVAYCRSCGKPLTAEERVWSGGAAFCGEHAPASAAAPETPPNPVMSPPSPYTSRSAPGGGDAIPGIALLLGVIPGVGAIYNGQYAKGLVHAVIFGFIITMIANGNAFLGLFIPLLVVWCFYMAIEAYHTARKRRDGEPVDEFSSLIQLRHVNGRFPVVPIILILLGSLFLLQTMDLISMDKIVRYWPLLLIVIGVYKLYERITAKPVINESEVRNER